MRPTAPTHLIPALPSPGREQFDTSTVRALSRADLEFGEALARRVAQIIARRMQDARSHLLDLYGPHTPVGRT